MKWGPDRWRLYGLACREAGRAIWGALARRPRFLAGSTRRVLIAPQDLRTSDPTVAGEIYAGTFAFAGRAVSTGGRSPFALDPPTRAWGEALYGFGWLRHLRAAETALARANARALVAEFLARRPRHAALARSTPLVARRTLSFLAQAPLLLEGADHKFYQRFLRALEQSARELSRAMRLSSQPLHRLTAAIALAYVGLCCEGMERLLRRANRALARELDRQILPDGGHRNRNPQVVIELLLDLLPLRQTYAGRGLEPPPALTGAIDRMLPFLRLLRHGDGSLARFNGMDVSAAGELATLLMYEGARGRAMRRAPHSGYERLEAGETVVVAEVGPAPPVDDAAEAHAGCLSFELSSGAQGLVVNCGAARTAADETRLAARSTAAHSTATVGGTSSGRLLTRHGWFLDRWIAAWLIRRLGPALVRGPRAVPVEREEPTDGNGAQHLTASHDGYRALRIVHGRRWRLSGRGDRLDGEDTFAGTGKSRAAEPATIRFHLAPGVRASRVEGGAILLVLPNREAWQFTANVEAGLEESVFFAASEGLRRTEQIVLATDTAATPQVTWRFERLPRAPERGEARRGTEAPRPML